MTEPTNASAAQPYAGPAGAGQLGAPLPPAPAPAPPAPIPGDDREPEEFSPSHMAFYAYHDHRDPPGAQRVQVVLVTHVDDEHVHGMVLGDARQLASFAPGELSHGYPDPATG
jgi:hypothetical protein